MSNDELKRRSVATAESYSQGNIASLDDAMTRRLIASVVLTESRGGNLGITNAQGYAGRYQAGAQWLVDAGYVDDDKLKAAMKGYRTEWAWADAGRRDNMDKFLADPSNWKNGLSLEKYLGSAELQDQAFKINSDKAYRQAIRQGVLDADDSPEKVAGFLKARHIAGYGGARAAVTGGREIADANGTSNYDYYNDIATNRDGLNQWMGRGRTADGNTQTPTTQTTTQQPTTTRPAANALADGVLRQGERGADVQGLQASLNRLQMTDAAGQPLREDGNFGQRTREAVERFQRENGLKVDGIAGPRTLEAIGQRLPPGTVTVERAEVTGFADGRNSQTQTPQPQTSQAPLITDATHPNNALYAAIARQLPPGTRPEAIANVTLQAMENGMTDPSRLGRVGVNNNDAFVMPAGSFGGNWIKVDLSAPTASLKAMSEHMAGETREAQQQQQQQRQNTQTIQNPEQNRPGPVMV